MGYGHKIFSGIAMLMVALVAVLAVPGAASAAPQADVFASYEGKGINLTEDGWGDATSCVTFSKSDVRCYETNAQANVAVGYTAPPAARADATWDCPLGWLCLYEHADGQGRRLIFDDDYWHQLHLYSFDRHVSSWRNAQVYLEWGELQDSTDQDGGCICTIRLYGGYQENLTGNRNDVMNYVYA
ncbi:peptidase inhibitor family I36 protein [Streptosporangium sp. NPDC048865]|uniref:peptidase inhibitor family I36 protein n=1 Tax=Streptosporangium sp. NPDC048865 TaxID=3155766 RepID=UPI003446A2E1